METHLTTDTLQTYTTREAFSSYIKTLKWLAEEHARTRTFPNDMIDEIAELVDSKPYGVISGHGGAVPNSYSMSATSTYINVTWTTWRRKKKYRLLISRGPAKRAPYGSGAGYKLSDDRQLVLEAMYPERLDYLRSICLQRKLRGFPSPPSEISGLPNAEVVRDGDICCVYSKYMGVRWIGTPDGWLKTYVTDKVTNPWIILRREGFPVPRRKRDRRWTEALSAYLVLHTLGQPQSGS